MSLNRFHLIAVVVWFVALSAVIGLRMAIGLPLTLAESAGVFLLGFLPAIVLVSVFRGAPPRTIGEVLYETERTTNPTRDLLARSAPVGPAHDRR